ncbi:MAG: hypothetical protein ACLFUU_08420 [Desulfobacteraceae bacterium]
MTDKKSAKKIRELSLAALAPDSQAALEELLEGVNRALAAGAEVEAVLAILASQPPGELAWDLALIARLAKIAHPAIPEALQRHFAPGLDKVRHKALKKAFHELKTRQVAVPALPPLVEPTSARPTTMVPSECHLSVVDSHGSRMVFLQVAKEGLGFNVLQALINDRDGLKDCYVLSLSKKRRRELLEEYNQEQIGQMVPVPPVYGLKLIEEAYSITADRNQEGPATYGRVRDLLLERIDLEAAPEVEDLLPPMEEPEVNLYLEKSRDLGLDEAFQTWLPHPEDMTPYIQKLRQVEESPLVLTEDQKRDRIDAVIAQAVEELFPPEERPRLSRRLLEMAHFLDCCGKPQEARVAQAVGIDVKRRRVVLEGENPFLLGLIWHSILAIAEYFKEIEEAAKQQELISAPSEPLITGR